MIRNRTHHFLASFAVVLLAAVSAHAQMQSDSLLRSYVQESWQSHPDLQSMRAMASAESSRTAMSRAWMNPEARFGLMNIPQSFDAHADPMTMWQIGLMQQVPFPGKLKASSRAGEALTESALATVEAGRYVMADMVAMAYYDLAASLAVRKSLVHGRDLAQQMMEAAAAMVSSGMGSEADIIRSRLEMEQWNIKLVNNQADIDRKRANLAYAVGRSEVATLSDPVLPDSLPPEIDLNSGLQSDAVMNTPELKRAQSDVNSAKADHLRARLDYWPDLNFGVAYGIRGYLRTTGVDPMTQMPAPAHLKQDNMWTFEVSAPLPLFYPGNQRAKVRETSAMQTAREADLSKARLLKEQQLREIYATWQENNDGGHIAQDQLGPQSENTWRVSLTDYRAGKITLMALSEARMAVVMAEMETIMRRADAWVAYRRWFDALGTFNVQTGSKQ
jgi:outer membrane protein TolC